MDYPIHVIDGVKRHLACLPPRPNFRGLPMFGDVFSLIPRSQWVETDLTEGMPDLVHAIWDQGQHGSCVGHGAGFGFKLIYALGGGTIPAVDFSPTSVYAMINGNRDQGAVVSDAMESLLNDGVALMSECPESVIYQRQIPSSALQTRARFKAEDCYAIRSTDEIGTALMLGYVVVFGMLIRSGFNAPRADGFIPHGGGVLGGHCMANYGLTRTSAGGWGFSTRNSWGTRFGYKGNCILDDWHYDYGGQLDAFAIRSTKADPMDPFRGPVVTVIMP